MQEREAQGRRALGLVAGREQGQEAALEPRAERVVEARVRAEALREARGELRGRRERVEPHGLLRDAQNVREEDGVRRGAARVAVEGAVDDAAADGRESEDRLDGARPVDRLPHSDGRARGQFCDFLCTLDDPP